MATYLDFEKLNKYFSYDKKTGILTRKLKVGCFDVGSAVGSKHDNMKRNKRNTYLRFQFFGKLLYVHRVAYLLATGEQPKEIDHLDGDGLNNKFNNLRSVSHKVNGKNQKKHITNTSGIGGVCYRKDSDKWRARIMVEGKMINLGTFKNKEDAIDARKEAEIEYGFIQGYEDAQAS